jgi:hypothetical protein
MHSWGSTTTVNGTCDDSRIAHVPSFWSLRPFDGMKIGSAVAAGIEAAVSGIDVVVLPVLASGSDATAGAAAGAVGAAAVTAFAAMAAPRAGPVGTVAAEATTAPVAAAGAGVAVPRLARVDGLA